MWWCQCVFFFPWPNSYISFYKKYKIRKRRELLCASIWSRSLFSVQPISGAHQGGRVKTGTKKAIRFLPASHVLRFCLALQVGAREQIWKPPKHTRITFSNLSGFFWHIYIWSFFWHIYIWSFFFTHSYIIGKAASLSLSLCFFLCNFPLLLPSASLCFVPFRL